MESYDQFRRILRNPSRELRDSPLCTNTWRGRHESKLRRLERTMFDLGMRDITLVQFGPGGVALGYLDLLPQFDEENSELLKKMMKRLVNPRETYARHQPGAKLECSETLEALKILSYRVGVKKTYVFDNLPQVVEAVNMLNLPNVEARVLDVDADGEVGLPDSDAVIFYHGLEYCVNPQRVIDRISQTSPDKKKVLSLTLPRDSTLVVPSYNLVSPNTYSTHQIPQETIPSTKPIEEKKKFVFRAKPLDEKKIMERANQADIAYRPKLD
ncbi:MAG TPA: hypothetical protein VHA12_03055 [Candidatus Nanoarchaeia archaeon]|nr:hypothetical protein [Candidatus Nanoarchaeia archaeon]